MRVGVVGLKMGLYLATWGSRVGMDVVVVCDVDPGLRAAAKERFPEAEVTGRWQDLLTSGLDGVVLANDFDAHAPMAAAFLDRGVSVLSEAAACISEEEGRGLIEAAENSSASYSFAENYVFHPHVRLIREAIDSGEVGRVSLVEADYLHGMSPDTVAALIGDPAHWRGRIAATAYCTHTVSPVLALTDAWPTEVTAFSIDEADPRAAVVMTVRLSTGALAVTRHGFLQGEPDSHWSWLSVRGSRALAESVRGQGEQAWSVRVRAEAWATPDGVTRDEIRVPPALSLDGTNVERSAEGTVRILRAFRESVERKAPPLIGVRAAVAASLVGVAGAQSLRKGSCPVPVPDLG
ncbi:Gfo/Idh/MocA family protein [Prauserella marina]|uniref:Gfo/Idh/MocA family protein n=1 Tax=Prauserella marina TaxID=530584 RepID=UPI000B865A59|nr:Gfo/Idh/MocA family oxidoreductase [Prauserella marina]